MAQVKTTEDGGLAVDVAVKPLPSKEMQRLSFVKSPETPPDTPADDVNISGIQGKTEPQDTLPEPSVQPVHEAKDNAFPASTDGAEVQSKAKRQNILPISTTQLEAKSDPQSPPAATEGYQDTVQTSPMNVVPPLVDSLSPAARLKHKLRYSRDLIVCPGVYDGLSARIAQSVGFETLYMTGAGSTASMLGMADLGIASSSDMVRNADMIANLDPHNIELIADMDTGYGGPVTITQTVNHYIRANVAAFHIEDQVLTKRCGHLSGKKVVTYDVFLSRIRAARAAIDTAQADIQLIARTDANQQLGYDECITRLKAARNWGADVGLLEGFKSKEEAARAVKELAPWPLLLNIVENGHSPLITVDEAREMGFRIMIFSFAGLAPAYMAMKAAYGKLKDEGITGIQGTGVGPTVLFDVCGLQEAVQVDEKAGGEDYKSIVTVSG
ncbi:MAG: hypothetical protein L6R38_008117 [Xanthoria sp. 2 TBL-2021]|nr:MAG: hypothetical protein L6R38_008117 [Xanthoria sp. 2 TBL-2021]